MTHTHYHFGGCQTIPIIDAKFKRLECPNLYLCESRQYQNLHQIHKLIKISNPQELEDQQKIYGQKQRPCTHHIGIFPHIFNNFMQLIEDPKFKEFKETVGSVAQEFFNTNKTEIHNQKKFNNKNNQMKKVSQKQQVDEQENKIQQEQIKCEIQEQVQIQKPVDNEIDMKIKQLAQIVDCSEQLVNEYVELFKELPLEEIVDIIYNQK